MNKVMLNCIMGALDRCPFAPRSKAVISEGAALLAGAGVNFLGNLLGFGSSQNANQTNLEIARMNNAQQYKMFKEQNAFNLDMWNKNNAYNAPAEQVQRLLAAGINPSAVFGSGSSTPASQIQSATAPQLQRTEVRPFTPDFDGFGQAVNAFFDNQMKSKAAEGTGVDNQIKMVDLQYRAMHHLGDLMEQKHRIDKLVNDMEKGSADRRYLEEQSEYLGLQIQKFKDTYDQMVDREKLQNDVMRAQEGNLLADSTLKRSQAQFQALVTSLYPSVTQAQLNVMSAQWIDLLNSATLKCKQGKLVDAQSVSQYIKNGLEGIEFEDKKLLHDAKTKNRVSKTFFYSIDMIGDMIFRNLKLFGK